MLSSRRVRVYCASVHARAIVNIHSTAQWMGVCRLALGVLGLAPPRINARVAANDPFAAARCKGVLPSGSRTSLLARNLMAPREEKKRKKISADDVQFCTSYSHTCVKTLILLPSMLMVFDFYLIRALMILIFISHVQ